MDAILHPPDLVGPHRISQWTPIAGDASGRQYWRVVTERLGTAVLCRYPEGWLPLVGRDLEILVWLRGRGLPVPQVLAGNPQSVWVLLEDLGRKDGESALRETEPASRVQCAAELAEPLTRVSELSADRLPPWNPRFDKAFLRWELAGFEMWSLSKSTREETIQILDPWLDTLAAAVAEHPSKICLRDFHLNNILVSDDRRVGIIDVQDLRQGPDTYDLACLLGDRAMPVLLDADQRQVIAAGWAERVGAAPGWERRLEATTLQRSLKVLGTFAFLSAKGLPHYERWVPTTAATAAITAEKFGAPPELLAILLDLATNGGFDVW